MFAICVNPVLNKSNGIMEIERWTTLEIFMRYYNVMESGYTTK